MNIILGLISRHRAKNDDEMFGIMNLLDPVLRNVNSGTYVLTYLLALFLYISFNSFSGIDWNLHIYFFTSVLFSQLSSCSSLFFLIFSILFDPLILVFLHQSFHFCFRSLNDNSFHYPLFVVFQRTIQIYNSFLLFVCVLLGAVLATVKCFLNLTAQHPTLQPQVLMRAKAPLMTLITGMIWYSIPWCTITYKIM